MELHNLESIEKVAVNIELVLIYKLKNSIKNRKIIDTKNKN